MRLTILLTALTAAAAAAAPLAAQQPAPPARPGGMGRMRMGGPMMPGMGMDSMMGPMMQAMAATPAHLLAQKAALQLTSAQESRITAIQSASMGEAQAAANQAGMHLREMVDVLHGANPDTTAMKHHFEAAMGFFQTAHWAMLRGAAQAWPVLTEVQRRQVIAMADSMGMGGGMMMQPGGMRHP